MARIQWTVTHVKWECTVLYFVKHFLVTEGWTFVSRERSMHFQRIWYRPKWSTFYTLIHMFRTTQMKLTCFIATRYTHQLSSVTDYITNLLHGAESPFIICHSASQEIPCPFWNPEVHYHVHKSRSLLPILSQTKPTPTFPTKLLKFSSNIILPYTPRS